MLALDPLLAQRQLAAGRLPLAVGQQRVVSAGCRERALGQAQHDDEIEVETDAHADGADENPLSEAADSAEVVFQFELQGAGEHGQIDRSFHRIEGGEAVDGPLDPLGRLHLGGRPAVALPPARTTQQLVEPAPGPCGVVGPAARLGRGRRQVVDHSQHERAEVANPLGVGPVALGPPRRRVGVGLGIGRPPIQLGGQLGQPIVPIGPAGDHRGVPRVPLPGGGRHPPVAIQDRCCREPREHVLAAKTVVGQGQQIEQGATGHAGCQWHDGGPVGRHTGGRQVLVNEPGVGLGAGVEDGDAVERSAAPGGVDDGPDCGPHLIIGVAGGHDPGAVGRHRQPGRETGRTWPGVAESGDGSQHVGIGPRLPGDSGNDDDVPRPGHCPQQEGGVPGELLGKVDDDRAHVRHQPRRHPLGRGHHQVLLVVPGRLQLAAFSIG